MAQMYKDIFKDKMGIVIVHKFNHYVDKANKIVVLKDGIINAIGTHAELENKSEELGGRYARACLLFFMLILALMLKMMLIAMRILSFGLREAVKCGKI